MENDNSQAVAIINDPEWLSEPDEVTLPDRRVLLRRNNQGAWCGYVGVDEEHPLYGVGYWDIPYVDVHGGLTYSGHRIDGDSLWYFGFDCAHGGDLCPNIKEMLSDIGYPSYHQSWEYRNLEYVMNNIEVLEEFLDEKREND